MYIKSIIMFFVLWVSVESAKILAVYPAPSLSHQVVFRKVTLELIKQGHEVTVITTDPAFPKKDGPQNLTEIDLHDITYNITRKVLKIISTNEVKSNTLDMINCFRYLQLLFEIHMNVPEVHELIFGKKKQFDLILIEDFARPYLSIASVFDAPVILFSSYTGMPTTLEYFGLQTHPILYPSVFEDRYYNLSFWEKAMKLLNYFSTLYYTYLYEKEEQNVMQKYFGPDMPKVSELYKNVHMLFLNIHSIWVDNQPVPPGIVFLGGLHQLERKELPQDLKSYLDSSKHGVIYVSFGSNVLSTMLPTDKIKIIAKVLGETPYDVLWKWDQDELPEQPKNVKLSKWLPQADLLKHPKIKLFIMQAGLQSTDEAITAGVPLVAFPVLGDQWYNAEKYERQGIGKYILFEEATEDKVKNAVETVLTDKTYRDNIIKLRELMNDQPMQPLELAMFWINHVIRHKGGKHLLAAGTNLTWTQYYEVELILILLSALSVLSIILSVFVYYLYKFIKSYVNKSKKIKKS